MVETSVSPKNVFLVFPGSTVRGVNSRCLGKSCPFLTTFRHKICKIWPKMGKICLNSSTQKNPGLMSFTSLNIFFLVFSGSANYAAPVAQRRTPVWTDLHCTQNQHRKVRILFRYQGRTSFLNRSRQSSTIIFLLVTQFRTMFPLVISFFMCKFDENFRHL